MRALTLLYGMFFVLLLASALQAAEVKSVITDVQNLMKNKEFGAAKDLLNRQIKLNKTSYKLWMALGYVLEIENDFKQALVAFERASELKPGIDGVAVKINRMRELAKIQPTKSDLPESEKLFFKSRVFDSQSKTYEACKLFVEAIELDRSLLAKDFGLIEKGLAFFQENPDLPEQKFYLGTFYFFAGHYSPAETILGEYVTKHPDGPKLKLAQKYILECKEIVAQILATNAPAQVQIATESGLIAVKTVDSPDTSSEAPVETQVWQVEETPANSTEAEPLEVTYARQKAIRLLNDYDGENDEEKKLGIIWQIGLLRLPFPEVMTSFTKFLESDNIETIFATIEALEKINLPGAQTCLRQLYNLLDHKNAVVVFRALKAFTKLPMDANRLVPKLFLVYQKQKLSIRKQMVANTLKAYGQESIDILNGMLKAAEGPNKRPLAEVLSILTGKDVENIINES